MRQAICTISSWFSKLSWLLPLLANMRGGAFGEQFGQLGEIRGGIIVPDWGHRSGFTGCIGKMTEEEFSTPWGSILWF